MKTLRVMDSSGDSVVTFDSGDVEMVEHDEPRFLKTANVSGGDLIWQTVRMDPRRWDTAVNGQWSW